MHQQVVQKYLNKRTLILGEVKSGKTARTLKVLEAFIRVGYASKIAVIDMAPDPVGGIGGKMAVPAAGAPLLHLTTAIAAPRLTGIDEEDIRRLAAQNARAIEALFASLRQHPKEILLVNDASLYLQAGDIDTFLALLDTASTQIINAYYGQTFPDSELSRRERRLVRALRDACDQVFHPTCC